MIPIAQVTVDIYGRLHKRSLDRTVGDMQRQMQDAGRNSGEAFGNEFARGVQRSTPRAQAAMIGVSNATEKVRIEQNKLNDLLRSGSQDFDKIARQADKVTRAYKQHDSALRNVQQSYEQFNRGADNAAQGASTLTQATTKLGGALGALGKIGTPVAVVGLGGALVEVAGVAASAAQSLWLLPAALTAAGAGIGTLKLATLGFSDALESIKDPEAFAEALQQLSPNAQQAALSIKGILPAIDELKRATQDALFSGVGQQLNTLSNQYLPGVQQMTTSIASSFGGMFRGVTDQKPETFNAIHEALGNIATAFQNLVPATGPLTQAFAEITKVGSGFLPELATAATQAAQAFSEFITQASQSGDLERWLSEGLDTLGLLGEAAWKFGEAMASLAPIGQAILPDIVRLLENVKELMPAIGAAAMLVGPPIGMWVTAADNASRAIGAIGGVFENVANIAIGAVNRITGALNTIIGPIQAIASLAGISIPSIPTVSPVNISGPGGAGAYLPKHGGSLPPAFGVPATAPTGPFNSLSPADRWLRADAAANPSAGPVAGAPGTYRRRDGSIGFTATPSMQTSPPTPLAGPYAASSGGGGGSATTDLPTVPYGNRDPMSLLQGYPVSSSLYGAAGSLIDAQQRKAQAESDLNALLKSNVATQSEIQDKRNALAKAEREQHEAELRLQEAKASATEKFTTQVQDLNSGISELSAGLDKDLGLSRGLAGLADNLVRFLGAIATAPLQAQLQRQINANPNEGSGIVGILAAQGAFGPNYTPQGIAASQQSYTGVTPQGMYAPQYAYPSFAAQPGQSAREFAHSTMMPFWQSQGLTVGDHAADAHGEHQNGALDIMVDSIEQGNAVLAQVLQDPNVYGAIFNRKSYGYGNSTPQDYNGASPHTDHVHAWYKPGGQNNIAPRQYGGAPWSQGMPTVPNLPIGAGGGQSPVLGGGYPGAGNALGGPGIGAGGYQPTQQPQAPQGWQPGAKGGGGGGVIGAAAGAAAGMFPGGGAAAQIAMQMIQRTIQYGGEVAGSLAQGALDFFSVSDPDGASGASLNESWLGRLAGSIASASPQLPSTAGGADKATEQGKAQQQLNPNAQQHGQGGGKPPGPLIGTMNVQADKMEAQKMAQTMQYASYASGMR